MTEIASCAPRQLHVGARSPRRWRQLCDTLIRFRAGRLVWVWIPSYVLVSSPISWIDLRTLIRVAERFRRSTLREAGRHVLVVVESVLHTLGGNVGKNRKIESVDDEDAAALGDQCQY